MNTQVPYTIVGLGATGLSVARFLKRRGDVFSVVDNFGKPEQTAKLKEIAPDAPLHVGEFEAQRLAQAETLVVNPGIAVKTSAIAKAKAAGSKVIGDIELFAQSVPAGSKLAAVTGSNGKSTCVSMLYAMAKAAGLKTKLGGNIGTPALDLLEDAHTDLYILELSSYQLETTESLDCDVACILNLSPDHLDRYDSYQGYIHAKKRLLTQTKKVVVFADDAEIASWQHTQPTTVFSVQAPADNNSFGLVSQQGETWLAKGATPLLAVGEMQLVGLHNAANALAALAMGEVLGLPMDAMLAALKDFTGLAHRMQSVATVNQVRWVNDSKATNVGASVAALAGLKDTDKQVILLAGGQTKQADLTPLRAAMTVVKQVLLFGEDAPLLAEALEGAVALQQVQDLHTACEKAAAMAAPGDMVLLSPAGASFDQFENFAARGDAFVQWVQEYANG